MRVAIVSDHAGLDRKGPIVGHLREEGYDVDGVGPKSGERCDYPDFGDKVGRHAARVEKIMLEDGPSSFAGVPEGFGL